MMTDTPLFSCRKSCETDQKSSVRLNPFRRHSKLSVDGRRSAKNRQGG